MFALLGAPTEEGAGGREEESGVAARILDNFQLIVREHLKDGVSHNIQPTVSLDSCPGLAPESPLLPSRCSCCHSMSRVNYRLTGWFELGWTPKDVRVLIPLP